MFRKLTLALGATVALAAAALAPTSASAWGSHHHYHGWGHGYGYGFGIYAPVVAPTYVAAPDCYYVKKVIDTPYGLKVRRVAVCS
jgi:hypothetical protein